MACSRIHFSPKILQFSPVEPLLIGQLLFLGGFATSQGLVWNSDTSFAKHFGRFYRVAIREEMVGEKSGNFIVSRGKLTI